MLDSITNIITLLHHQPSMWSTEEFASLRGFVHEISSQPSLYPPPSHYHGNDINRITHHDCSLSKEFVSTIYREYVRSRSDIDYDPILKVQSVSSRHSTCTFVSITGGKYE